ncbi:hypothetical protein SAMN04515674_109172 [Pseudarcicella hirudinis]|uniref:Uncharacterized protein n=1 Tax=Pseudarcicella hirudinis TaxID=1079859 RepID=A0A1I5VLR7_9BACT|nr:hypothetical protein SAMN04515674_109172 [Pseudarcicella hirudinis]
MGQDYKKYLCGLKGDNFRNDTRLKAEEGKCYNLLMYMQKYTWFWYCKDDKLVDLVTKSNNRRICSIEK